MTSTIDTLAHVIRGLSAQLTTSAPSTEAREAAKTNGGVPVYEDLGGVLVIDPRGVVVRYDPENKAVEIVSEEGWQKLALTTAARKYPELSSLVPARPLEGIECPACAGNGITLNEVTCGSCFGIGWILG